MFKLRQAKEKIVKLYKRNLFVSNTLSCMTLLAVGDGVTQYAENNVKEASKKVLFGANLQPAYKSLLLNYDWSRTAKMFILGSPVGSIQHLWYTFLDKKFPKQKTKSIIFKKLLVDIFCYAPILNAVIIAGKFQQKKKTKLF